MQRLKTLLVPALLAILLAIASPAAQTARAQGTEPVFPTASRIGLVPPPGFQTQGAFPGYRHVEKAATILVAELPGEAFDSIEKQITTELQREAQIPVTRSDIQLKSGGSGFLLQGKPSGPQGPVLRWTMVAHIGGTTAVVTAIVPEQVKEVASDEAIRAAFATLTVRDTVPFEEQLSVLPFSMSDLAGFRVLKVDPGQGMLLTEGAKNLINVTEQPLVMIAIAATQTPQQPNEREALARRLLGEIPGLKETRVTRSEPLRVAGAQGHEILIEGKDAGTGADITAVQWLRFGSGTLLRIVGMTNKANWSEMYPRFRKVRDGIGPK